MADRMMKDWSALVRERLLPLDLPAKESQEVVAELAAHLEDMYEEQIGKGLSESEAGEKVMTEVARGRLLAKNIQRAKLKEGMMNTRTKQLWLPSLVSLTTAMVSLMFLTLLGVQPRLFYAHFSLAHHAVTTLYLPWLAALPLCGAAGAYLSRRAGGERFMCLASSLFPAAALLGCFCFVLLDSIFGTGRAITPAGFLLFVWNWVFLPGSALLLGALPFLGAGNQRIRSVAS
jgi:hypothetical protein